MYTLHHTYSVCSVISLPLHLIVSRFDLDLPLLSVSPNDFTDQSEKDYSVFLFLMYNYFQINKVSACKVLNNKIDTLTNDSSNY